MFKKIYFFYSNVFLKGVVLPLYYRLLKFSFKLFGIFAKASVSQFSEDLIIEIILKNAKRKRGIFVDVGCNHPIEYNNTYLLYLSGRRGINIDGNKNLIDLYKRFRKGDTSLNYLVSDKEEEVVFHLSSSDKLSTIQNDHIDLSGKDNFSGAMDVVMKTKTLNAILEAHLDKQNPEIDLLCIDVEGHDFEVISSIDLDKYKPYLIVIEMHDFSPTDFARHRIYDLLSKKQYTFSHYVFSTGYFIRN